MYDVNDLPSLPVYEWDRAKKRAFLDAELSDLTDWHAARCPEYARMRDAWPAREEGFEALPFLPVRLFKELTLKSVPDEALHRHHDLVGHDGSAGEPHLPRPGNQRPAKQGLKPHHG